MSEATATRPAPEPASPAARPAPRRVRLRVVLLIALVAATTFLAVELLLTRGGGAPTGAAAADALVARVARWRSIK